MAVKLTKAIKSHTEIGWCNVGVLPLQKKLSSATNENYELFELDSTFKRQKRPISKVMVDTVIYISDRHKVC